MKKRISVFTLIASLTTVMSSVAFAQGTEVAGGDVRAPSPRIMDPNRPDYVQIGVGPAFALGLDSDDVMYNVNIGYNRNINDRFTAKIFSDMNLGTGGNDARFINLAVGGDMYLQEIVSSYGIPYVTGDIGYGFTRNDADDTKDAVSLGAGAGFKFAAQSLNLDVNLHYSILTAELDGTPPSVLGLRVALNF